jgi:hypothetical protein
MGTNHGMPYMLHTLRGSSTIRRTYSLAMMANMEHISLTSFGVLQFLLLHPPLLLLWVLQLQPLLLLLPVHLLQMLQSHLELLPIMERSKIFSSGASRPWYPCAAPMMLLSMSHTSRWARGSLLLRSASARCAHLWVWRPRAHCLSISSSSSCEIPVGMVSQRRRRRRRWRRQWWRWDRGRIRVKTVVFSSLFFVFDAKGRRRSLLAIILYISSYCNMN